LPFWDVEPRRVSANVVPNSNPANIIGWSLISADTLNFPKRVFSRFFHPPTHI
jgi:hypothetical protein